MTEIKIEKRKAIWPWIVAGLLLAAIILYFLFLRPDKEVNNIVVKDTASVTHVVTAIGNTEGNGSQEVNAFISYADSDTTSMGLDHEYTHTALLKLADATQALAVKVGYDAKGDIDMARTYADKITNDPMATTHADNIKKATGLLSTAIQNIQKAGFPQFGNESEDLKSASRAIDPRVLTLDQKPAIRGGG